VSTALPQPNRDRLSALAALVLLAISLVRIVVLPELVGRIEVFGLAVSLHISTGLILLLLASAVTVTGSDWLVRSHPRLVAGPRRYDHLILPGLSTLAFGLVLISLPEGPGLWIGLPLAAALLLAVLVAEFLVVDATDPRAETAALGLRASAIAVLGIGLTGILGQETRAFFAIPAAWVGSAAVAWRILRLHTGRAAPWSYALATGAVTAELAWALHYWPLAPLAASLSLTVITYLTIGLIEAHLEGRLGVRRAAEYAAVAAIGLAAILGWIRS
jgi:hypothetical protein